jgi:hypothetical protein
MSLLKTTALFMALISFFLPQGGYAFIGLNAGSNMQSVQPWWTKQDGSTTGTAASTEALAIASDSSKNYFVVGSTTANLDGNIINVGITAYFITKYDVSGSKQWTKTAGPPGYYSFTVANAVAVDTSDNIYVTGEADQGVHGNSLIGYGDAFIAKYDTSGNIIWTKEIGVADGVVVTYGIGTDSSNNVYVVGTTDTGLDGNALVGNTDMFVMKFNSSGVKQWTKELGVAGDDLVIKGLAIDSSANVYVTGNTNTGFDGNTLMGATDFFVTKFDSSGTKAWTKELGVSSAITEAYSVAVDTSGNAYIGGTTRGGLDGNTLSGSSDFFVTKYSSAGVKAWTKQLGASGKSTYGLAVKTDSSNNVFITGDTTANLDGNTLVGNLSYFITKYNTSGTKQWTKENGGASGRLYPYGITVDGSDNLVITGSTNVAFDGHSLTGVTDIFNAKYDTSGTKIWTTQLGGTAYTSVHVTGLGLDSSKNIYIGGYLPGSMDGLTQTGLNDFYLAKYNSTGSRLWSAQLGVASKSTTAAGIVLDSSSNVYITGSTRGGLDGNTLTGNTDFFLSKYNSSGTKQWTKQLGVASRVTDAYAVGADSSDNVYVVGATSGNLDGVTITGTQDAFITKYNSAGTKQWTKLLGVSSTSTQALGIVFDSSDNLYIVGYTGGNLDGNTLTGTDDTFIAKFNSAGTKQWTKLLGASGSDTSANNITIDSSNNLYIAGYSNGSLPGNTITNGHGLFCAKFDSTGTRLWVKEFDDGNFANTISGITISNSYLYLTGTIGGPLEDSVEQKGVFDLLILKFDLSGNLAYTRQYGVGDQRTQGAQIKSDADSRLYVTGTTTGAFDGQTQIGAQDYFISKFGGN